MSAKTTNLIQDKLAKLNEYVAWFDSDEFALEQAVDKFAEAEKLAEEIEQDLAGFKNEINVIKKKFDQE
jgi:exodeoxyribonuclease VII small subunit